jgi:hypothetical protein
VARLRPHVDYSNVLYLAKEIRKVSGKVHLGREFEKYTTSL